jgi:hypothetical protein
MSISSRDEAGAMLYDIFGRVGGGSMHALVNAMSISESSELTTSDDDDDDCDERRTSRNNDFSTRYTDGTAYI